MIRSSKDLKLTFQPTSILVGDGGDLAAEQGTYQISFTGPKGKKIEDHGNYVTVWKKVGGQWKVLYDINAWEVPAAM
jgi:ketosteroid isomerase-like protein